MCLVAFNSCPVSFVLVFSYEFVQKLNHRGVQKLSHKPTAFNYLASNARHALQHQSLCWKGTCQRNFHAEAFSCFTELIVCLTLTLTIKRNANTNLNMRLARCTMTDVITCSDSFCASHNQRYFGLAIFRKGLRQRKTETNELMYIVKLRQHWTNVRSLRELFS